jgi:uncharacterized membrane protein YhhN
MYIWPILAIAAALWEAVIIWKDSNKFERLAKPAVMVFLFLWLYTSTGLSGNILWFGMGILLSLVGDVLLISYSDRMFVLGMVAFLFTHIFYLMGFQEELLHPTAWSFILLFFIFMNGFRLLRRILGAMRATGQNTLMIPVTVYGLAISLMLYAAMSTIFDPAWKTSAAFFVSAGAFLFYISDLILAWNKFVSPVKNGPVLNIITYHFGQISLIAGVISQFG